METGKVRLKALIFQRASEMGLKRLSLITLVSYTRNITSEASIEGVFFAIQCSFETASFLRMPPDKIFIKRAPTSPQTRILLSLEA